MSTNRQPRPPAPRPAPPAFATRGTAPGGRGRAARAALLLALWLAWATPAAPYEADQYSNRLAPVADSAGPLNEYVNQGLARVVEDWEGPASSWRFALAVYWKLGGIHWVDRIERWAMKSPEVAKLPQRRRHSIYAGAPFWATRVNFVFGVGRTLRLAGVLVGSDKLGHFFSQGLKYYGSYFRGESEEEVLARGKFNERWIFGQLTTSVYCNADLVANYEGYLFYRSLSEDGVVAGKTAIIGWRDGKPFVRRPFDWADHVNDYWDEALNPSHLSRSLQRFMDRKLPELCPEYWQRPEAFVPRDEEILERRYADLGLKPAPQNRIDHVCQRLAAEGGPGD